jgi:hypothetical protein
LYPVRVPTRYEIGLRDCSLLRAGLVLVMRRIESLHRLDDTERPASRWIITRTLGLAYGRSHQCLLNQPMMPVWLESGNSSFSSRDHLYFESGAARNLPRLPAECRIGCSSSIADEVAAMFSPWRHSAPPTVPDTAINASQGLHGRFHLHWRESPTLPAKSSCNSRRFQRSLPERSPAYPRAASDPPWLP